MGSGEMEETLEETIDRMMNETAELRIKVSHNADLYRRDVQYALDLMGDVSYDEISVEEAKGILENRHERGRAELQHWRDRQDESGKGKS